MNPMTTSAHEINLKIKDKIAHTFFIEDLADDVREDLFAQIIRIVFQAVLLRITPFLDEEDLARYNKILEAGANADECTDFFLNTVPVFESVVYEEIQNIARILEKENPGAISQLNAEKKIEDVRNTLLQKFS
ncbi:MAG: hypothetical protein ACK4FA_02425 [Candidatus Paceibacteria bacterium]